MRRPAQAPEEGARNLPFPDEDWVKRFPLLCSYLADVLYDDGTLREASTLSIKHQDGLVLASLSDVDLERGLYRVGPCVRDALVAIEKALASPAADWRPWKKGGSKKGK